jgi:hypothetical protein
MRFPSVWNDLNNENPGFMNVLSQSVRTMECRRPGLLPDLRQAKTLVVGSDYGGQHAAARFEAFSFIIADVEPCVEWAKRRRLLRDVALSDGRRLEYKSLKDRKRQAVLLPFLAIANELPGLLVSVLVDKEVSSLFGEGSAFKKGDLRLGELAGWSPSVAEKFLRIVHLLSFFLAGLSAPGQHVFWISDQDEIVANQARLYRCVELLAHIASNYLPHSLGTLRVSTTASDTGSRDLEDFVAIPDLVCGALVDAISGMKSAGPLPVSEIIRPLSVNLSLKAKAIVEWLSDDSQPLRRLVYLIDEEPGLKRLRATCLHFGPLPGPTD